MGLVQYANELAALRVGAFPFWSETDAATDTASSRPPTAAGDGQALEGAVVALIRIKLREESWRRKATITITSYDAGTTYTVGNGAVSINTMAAGSAALAAAALKTAIDGNGTLSALWSTEVDGAVLTIRGKSPTTYALVVTTSGGAGTFTAIADAITGKARIWLTEGGDPGTKDGSAWEPAVTQVFASVTAIGAVERYEVAGHDRIYVEIYDLATTGDTGTSPHATARIGRCLLPSTATT